MLQTVQVFDVGNVYYDDVSLSVDDVKHNMYLIPLTLNIYKFLSSIDSSFRSY